MNIYSLPFVSEGVEIKAVSDPRVHFAHFSDAIDFLLDYDTDVLASLDGTVVDVKVDSAQGGAEDKYKEDISYTNYVTLQHADGEYSQYIHLKCNSSLVRVGDEVKRGQVLAKSGLGGYATQPHIHFQVFKLCDDPPGWKTIPIVFNCDLFVFRPEIV